MATTTALDLPVADTVRATSLDSPPRAAVPASTTTDRGVLISSDLLALFATPDNAPLLKRAFALYAAKNQMVFAKKEGAHQAGFGSHESLTNLDQGELLVFLKGFRIVPRWISAEAVKNLFSQVHFEQIGHPTIFTSFRIPTRLTCIIRKHNCFYTHMQRHTVAFFLVVVAVAFFSFLLLLLFSTWSHSTR